MSPNKYKFPECRYCANYDTIFCKTCDGEYFEELPDQGEALDLSENTAFERYKEFNYSEDDDMQDYAEFEDFMYRDRD